MHTSTRRGFLVITGTGAAAAAAASVPMAAAATTSSVVVGSTGPVVAYVRDPASGVVSVMSGEREVIVRDRRLATLIASQIG